MSGGLFVFIGTPAANAVVGRHLKISGSVSGAGSGSLSGVWLHLGGETIQVRGPARRVQVADWSWEGDVPKTVRPGQPFQITVTSSGTITTKGGPEPEFEDVDGEATLNVVLENIVPVLTVEPFQSPIVVTGLPYVLDLKGTLTEGGGPTYGVPLLQAQIDNGPLTNLEVSQGVWHLPLTLQPGDHPITLRASDRFDSVTTFQKTLTVIAFTPPEAAPDARLTLAGVPTTSSVTSWTRLEPQSADADIGTSANARLYDPLWLMTRQWQMGEFQGEDTGSPVRARVRATQAPLTRCRVGELSAANLAAPTYDPAGMPLEALVERRRMRPANPKDHRMLPLTIEAGLHFLRMLEFNPAAKKYRPAFLAMYVLQALEAAADAQADEGTRRLMQTMAGRAPDARRLAAAFGAAPGQPIALDAALKIAAVDLVAVQQVAAAWLAWYDGLFAEPGAAATANEDAWSPSRLEYTVSVAARLSAQSQDALTLSATEFDGGRLDWSSFDVNTRFSLDTATDQGFAPLNATVIPAPVSFKGAPAARFWEMEDAKVAYGLLAAGPTDLAHLMMIEYAGSYGNDWYVVPLTLPVGSITKVDSLVVTDTFGVRSLLRPLGDPALRPAHFSMWQQAGLRHAGEAFAPPTPNCFFLPPTLGRSLDGASLEDVLLMRDEMANVAWGIERSVESPAETALPLASQTAVQAPPPPPPPSPTATAAPRYLLSSTVPANWIPLLPVQVDDHGTLLQRGAVSQPDGPPIPPHARSEALNASASLLIYDEEIPREGVQITRRRRLTRWVDGSTIAWTALRNQVGRGEGSGNLRFDRLQGPDEI